MSRLAEYLEKFEANAKKLGVQVHWAADADEHKPHCLRNSAAAPGEEARQIEVDAHRRVSPQSFLEEHGFEVVDSDLGERIVQLAKERPSHIVLRRFTRRRKTSAHCFTSTCTRSRRVGTRTTWPRRPGNICATSSWRPTRASRRQLRHRRDRRLRRLYERRKRRLGVSLPKLHIACMESKN